MTETNLLEGEITENPRERDVDVEKLLLGFIRALADEQKSDDPQNLKSSIVATSLSVEMDRDSQQEMDGHDALPESSTVNPLSETGAKSTLRILPVRKLQNVVRTSHALDGETL